MVEVEIAVVSDLPVRAGDGLAPCDVTEVEAVVSEHLVVAAEKRVDVHEWVRRAVQPHQPGTLGNGQGCEPVAVAVDVAEIVGVHHSDQAAGAVVRPGVVRTGVSPCRSRSRFGDDRSSVAAHVVETAQFTVVPAGHEERGPGDFSGDVGVAFRQFARGRHDHGQTTEHLVHLPAPSLVGEVVGDRYLDHALGLILGSGGLVRQVPLGDRDQLFSTHRRCLLRVAGEPNSTWLRHGIDHRGSFGT